MCAYKLCKVDFRYWGMQAKLEKFIHDFGKGIVHLCTIRGVKLIKGYHVARKVKLLYAIKTPSV